MIKPGAQRQALFWSVRYGHINGFKSKTQPDSGKRTAKDKQPIATSGEKEVGGKASALQT